MPFVLSDLFLALIILILCSCGQELHFSDFLPSGFQVAMGNGRQQLRFRERENPGYFFYLDTAASSAIAACPPWLQISWTTSPYMTPVPTGWPLPCYSFAQRSHLLASDSTTSSLCPFISKADNSLWLLLIAELSHHPLVGYFLSPV